MEPAALKARIDLRAFYQAEVGTGKRSGKALLDRVPWRVDRHPSLNVYADWWVDKANGDGGDIFSLVERLYNLSFHKAIQYVEAWAGEAPGTESVPKRRPPASSISEPPVLHRQSKARRVIGAGQRYLWSEAGRAGLDYLHQRGLTDDTIRAARLGYASAVTMDRLFGGKYSLSDAIIIPWVIGPDVWAVKFRRLTPSDDPKYIQLGGLNQAGALYIAGTLRPDLPVIFVEGEIKALIARQHAADLANFVTTGSARNPIPIRFRSLATSAPLLILIPDRDETGEKAAHDNALRLPDNRVIIPVPQTLGYAKAIDDFAALGGDVRAFITSILHQPVPDQETGSWPGSLPITYRAALHEYAPDSVAPYLELRCEAMVMGLAFANQPLTIAELIDLSLRTGRGVTEWTLRRAATWLTQHLAVLPPEDSFQRTNKDSLIGKTAKQPPHAKIYPMPSLSQIRQLLLALAAKRLLEAAFPDDDPAIAPINCLFDDALDLAAALEEKYGMIVAAQPGLRRKLDQAQREYARLERRLDDLTSVPLPGGWTYRDRSEYAACCARAIKVSNLEQDLSQAQWSECLGASLRAVSPILKRAGILSFPSFEAIPVTSPAQIRQIGYTKRAYPRQIVDANGSVLPYSPEALEKEVTENGQAIVRFQRVNHQVLDGGGQPSRPYPSTRSTAARPVKEQRTLAVSVEKPGAAARTPYCGLDHDPAWRERGRVKLLERVTPWVRRGETLLDLDSGVLVPYSPQAVIDRLLQTNTDSSEATGDPLLDLVTNALGGVILSVEVSERVIEKSMDRIIALPFDVRYRI